MSKPSLVCGNLNIFKPGFQQTHRTQWTNTFWSMKMMMFLLISADPFSNVNISQWQTNNMLRVGRLHLQHQSSQRAVLSPPDHASIRITPCFFLGVSRLLDSGGRRQQGTNLFPHTPTHLPTHLPTHPPTPSHTHRCRCTLSAHKCTHTLRVSLVTTEWHLHGSDTMRTPHLLWMWDRDGA